LSGCSTIPKLPAPLPTVNECPRVQRCSLPAVSAASNSDLLGAVDRAEAAWAQCAAVVDVIVDCQAAVDQVKGQP
jgi:hypothetical protein